MQERRLNPHQQALPEIGKISAPGLALPFRAESWLSAGLYQGHVGVGEAKMVTDLVDQHVADDAVHWLAVLRMGMHSEGVAQGMTSSGNESSR